MNKFFSKIKTLKYQLFCYSMIQLFVSCSDFLDIVPDNVFQYDDLFSSQQQALTALATLYHSVPRDHIDAMPWTMGDEFAAVSPAVDAYRSRVQGASIMRGNQSASNPLLSLWTGNNSMITGSLWIIIRECDQFIQNVDRIPDMTAEGKADWKAQAKFLKAYYMFMLVKAYGPVNIPETFAEGDLNAELFQPRAKVEDCFDYILNLIDEAIPYLKGKRESTFLGQVDQVTAKAIKARILLCRASPFYNGNAEYYSNFLDHNGEHFFAQTEDREKWKAAANAAQVALDACEQYGFSMYYFKGRPYDFDAANYQYNTDRMKTLYDLRFRISERWNEEIIWGYQKPWNMTGYPQLMFVTMIRKPAGYGTPAATNDGGGWLQSSYQAMERFYTENGLPLEEDRTVNRSALHEIVTTPDEYEPEYASMRGFLQPRVKTINMYLRREPRFYSDLFITGGYARQQQVFIPTEMYYMKAGGWDPVVHGEFFPSSGIGVQKIVHPESYCTNIHTMMLAPYPIMRVSDLWLMKAEAMNEYYGPSQEVYDAVNEVRRRAGIPDVEISYSNPEWVTEDALDKHKSKHGMREIILRERANEFAFEFAHRFWDMQRWKLSIVEFSRPLYGWNIRGTDEISFFNHQIIQGRKWSITDCLWPIDNSAMERNAKLIQNPGW